MILSPNTCRAHIFYFAEGDDEFFVQMIQAEDELELGLSVKDDV